MTPEEIDKVAECAIEKLLVRLPEVVGNLIQNQAMLNKMNREFYEKYPDFANNKALVVQVLEEIEGKDPSQSYEEILQKSVPVIQRRLGTINKLDLTKTEKPSTRLKNFSVEDPNGVL
jgi:hypothetical protein